jgi:hypothetical protein
VLETVRENGAVSSSGLQDSERHVRTLKMADSMVGYQMLEIQNSCKILRTCGQRLLNDPKFDGGLTAQ